MDGDWSKNLVEALRNFQAQGYLCDMDIVSSDGSIFQVHSCIMAATSRVLKAAISNWISEPDGACQQNRLFVQTKTSTNVLEYVIHCMYAGSIKIETDYLEEVQEALSDLEVRDPHALSNEECSSTNKIAAPKSPMSSEVELSSMEDYKTTDGKEKEAQVEDTAFEIDSKAIKEEETFEINQILEDAAGSGDDEPAGFTGDDPSQSHAFKCGQCDKSFKLKAGMLRHVRAVHRKLRPHECQHCQKCFKENSKLQKHIMSRHSDNVPQFACPICKKTFVQKSGITRHVNSVHKKLRPHRCRHCARSFSETSKLREHLARAHGQNPPENGIPRQRRTGKYARVPGPPVQCEQCGKNFAQPSILKRHINGVHSDIRPYPCDKCGKAFKERSKLREHLMTHSQAKVHKCAKCSKEFSLRSSFWRHQLTCQSDYKPHQCEACGNCFKLKSQLTIHIKHVHKGIREYHCSHCFKAFSSRTLVRVHERVHTGLKPYKCPHCLKGFNQAGSFTVHLKRYHTMERPYPCRTCSKAYVTSYERKVHEAIHKDTKDFQCSLCGKAFPGSGNLHMHMKTHSDHRPHQCPVCDKMFKTKSHLSRHQSTHTKSRHLLVFTEDNVAAFVAEQVDIEEGEQVS